MGYSLTIGEAEIEFDDERVDISAKLEHHENAPAYGEPTDHENQRWPSYSSWHDAMESLGLINVMFNERNGGSDELKIDGEYIYPLLDSHPGAQPITLTHVEYVEEKIREHKEKYPEHIAQYPPPNDGTVPITGNIYRVEDLSKDPKYDSALCRGEWLAYWLRWSIDNCEKPVFVNT